MIVIPMAGLSSRFFEAGYEVPKYMLPLRGGYVFDYSLNSFSGLFKTESFLFVAREIQNTAAFISKRANALGIEKYEIVVLNTKTRGQAETVFLGLQKASKVSGPLCIFNIDSHRKGFTYRKDVDYLDGYLEVFVDEGAHWSFVEPKADTDRVLRTTEKVRISKYCSNGMYIFRSPELFEQAFVEEASGTEDELYIAPIYNRLIALGCDIRYSLIDRELVSFCGVPCEYENLLKKDRQKAQ